MKEILNLVVISDTHSGCRFGLHHPDGHEIDGGNIVKPSPFQRQLWGFWRQFCDEWVPHATHGEPYAVLHNAECIDGVHHGSTTQWSHNLEDQRDAAVKVLEPFIDRAQALFMTRGTEAHGGKSGENEEAVAKRLGAVPDPITKQHARNELWLRLGGALIHAMHHIGTTGSNHYEATAVNKELSEEFVEAGRWGKEPPQVVVRSHRHRNLEIRVPTARGYGISFVTPGWQGKTPFAWRIAGARLSAPQFGGSLIRWNGEELYTRHCVWTADRGPIDDLRNVTLASRPRTIRAGADVSRGKDGRGDRGTDGDDNDRGKAKGRSRGR